MKTIVRSHLIGSAFFLIVGLSFSVWFYFLAPSPLLPPLPSELNVKVEAISDIEHLRKFALLMTKNYNETLADANRVIRNFVILLLVLCFGAAYLLLESVFHLRKLSTVAGAADRR